MPTSDRIENETRTPALTRRAVLVGAGTAASLASAGVALAGSKAGASSEHHHYTEAKAVRQHPALRAATDDCIGKGQACISHCMETFVRGDTTMGECAFAVQQMLHVCTAMSYLVAYDSKHLKSMARTCIEVCESCEKACRVHEEHQAECRACADACAALVKEAKKVSA